MPEDFNEKDQRIEWLPNKLLFVIWISAQRPYRKSHARKIASNFDPDRLTRSASRCRTAMASIIADGQTRKAAVENAVGRRAEVP